MADIGRDRFRTGFLQGCSSICQRAARVAHVVQHDAALAAHITDDVHHFGFSGFRAALVDDGEICIVEPLGEGPRAHHAANVRRDDHDLVLAVALLDIVDHHRAAEEVIGRDVEEALDLAGVQVDGQDAVGAGRGDQIGNQLGRDRRAPVGLPVLPGIAEIGDHGRDAPGRGALQRIHHDQQLHQIVIGRVRGRLDDEDVLAADILIDADEDFLVCEGFHLRAGQSHVQIVGNGLGQRAVRVASEKFHVGCDPVLPRMAMLL